MISKPYFYQYQNMGWLMSDAVDDIYKLEDGSGD
jgi:hypothetical protein